MSSRSSTSATPPASRATSSAPTTSASSSRARVSCWRTSPAARPNGAGSNLAREQAEGRDTEDRRRQRSDDVDPDRGERFPQVALLDEPHHLGGKGRERREAAAESRDDEKAPFRRDVGAREEERDR